MCASCAVCDVEQLCAADVCMYVLVCMCFLCVSLGGWEGQGHVMARRLLHAQTLFVFVTSNEVHVFPSKAHCAPKPNKGNLAMLRLPSHWRAHMQRTPTPSTSLPLLLRLCALVSCSFWKTRYNSSFIDSGVCTSSRTPPSTQRYSRTHTSRAPHNTGAGGNHKRTRAASLNRISITQTRTGRGTTSIARS